MQLSFRSAGNPGLLLSEQACIVAGYVSAAPGAAYVPAELPFHYRATRGSSGVSRPLTVYQLKCYAIALLVSIALIKGN